MIDIEGTPIRQRIPCLILNINLLRPGMRASVQQPNIRIHDIDSAMEAVQASIEQVYAEPVTWLTIPPDAWPDETKLFEAYPRAAFRDPVTGEILYLFCSHSRMETLDTGEEGEA